MTPFFANHEFYPCIGIEPPGMFKGEGEQKVKLLVVDKIVFWQEEMMSFLQDQLAWSQDKQTWFMNKTCQPHFKYKIGDKVYVDARHFASERDKKSLNLKNAGPWEIVQNINNKTYKLKILKTLKNAGLTPIFHLWKMYLAPNNVFLGQILPSSPLIKISTKDNKNHEAHKEWEVLEVVDCHQTKQYGVQYKATYIENWDKWNASPLWQPWTDFKRSRDKIDKFHCTHPWKLKPPLELATVDSSLDNIRVTLASSV